MIIEKYIDTYCGYKIYECTDQGNSEISTLNYIYNDIKEYKVETKDGYIKLPSLKFARRIINILVRKW